MREQHASRDTGRPRHSPCWGRHSPWCCGPLQTGAISVGFMNVVSLVLAYLWLVPSILESNQVFIYFVVASIVAFVLGVVNACLIYGAQKEVKSMLAPWLVIYLMFLLALMLALPLAWALLAHLRPVVMAAIVIIVYCYTVVTFYFNELKSRDELRSRSSSADVEVGGNEAKAHHQKPIVKKNGAPPCLILLEDQAQTSFSGDDTFTNLAGRSHAKVLESDAVSGTFSSNNPFASMIQAEDSGEFKASFLPKPEEVIPVNSMMTEAAASPPKQMAGEPEETEGLLSGSGDSSPVTKSLISPISDATDSGKLALRRQKSEAQATALAGGQQKVIVSNSVSDVTGGEDPPGGERSILLGISRAHPGPSASKSMSHSGLVDIDTSFTPFKKKGSTSDGLELPKMKIFLPHHTDEDSSSNNETSSDEN